jgi:predicted flap endonuclease-1-like 5' DNA nuclease
MGIIDTIASALRSLTGSSTGQSDSTAGSTASDDRRAGQVSVEHEPDADASTEAAVKGTESDADDAAEPADATAEPDTASDVDGDDGDDADGDDGPAEPDDEPPADGADDAGGSDEPTETITGIGPAYAERLESIGIETVGELAAADAAEVADGIDVSESRVGDWIERARDAS